MTSPLTYSGIVEIIDYTRQSSHFPASLPIQSIVAVDPDLVEVYVGSSAMIINFHTAHVTT